MSQSISLSPYKIISKKRDGKKLTQEEMEWFLQGYLKGPLPDYQMAALLMAFYLKGLDPQETAYLTNAMLHSGKILQFEGSNVVDKHSTGGIGDKASFILAPIAAAAGVKVPMVAGRGLGHTGGTIDKVEAIAGFKTHLSLEQFSTLLLKNGLVLMGQTQEFAPLDRKIYALRDVTATIDSIPLITASIMSKKLAEGIKGLVLDIKYGKGAFMKSRNDAIRLAKSLMKTAEKFQVHSMGFITDMSQPLGNAVGHSLEIMESLETLKGQGPKDLTDLSLELAGGMIYLAGLSSSHRLGIRLAREALISGEALQKFKILIEGQGGDPLIISDYKRLPLAPQKRVVLSPRTGRIKGFENEEIGFLLTQLGGGRVKSTDKIDHGVGFVFHKKIGHLVKKHEPLLTIYHHPHQEELVSQMEQNFIQNIITLSQGRPKAPPLIFKRFINWRKDD